MYMYTHVHAFSFTEELYADVNGDFFAFNKIPRILFQHKERCLYNYLVTDILGTN